MNIKIIYDTLKIKKKLMGKFRIIEEGRILTQEEMGKAYGGRTCSDTEKYASCTSIKFLYTSPCALYIVCSESQFSMCGSSALETCEGTMKMIAG